MIQYKQEGNNTHVPYSITDLLFHKVRENPEEGDCNRVGEHLRPFLQSGQRFPDQLSLGSKGRVDDHHQLLAVDQEVLKDCISFVPMEGVRVEEVEPDEFVRRVECLTRVKISSISVFIQQYYRTLPAIVDQDQEAKI